MPAEKKVVEKVEEVVEPKVEKVVVKRRFQVVYGAGNEYNKKFVEVSGFKDETSEVEMRDKASNGVSNVQSVEEIKSGDPRNGEFK